MHQIVIYICKCCDVVGKTNKNEQSVTQLFTPLPCLKFMARLTQKC